MVVGFAAGSAIGGVLIEASGWRAALLTAAAAAAIGRDGGGRAPGHPSPRRQAP